MPRATRSPTCHPHPSRPEDSVFWLASQTAPFSPIPGSKKNLKKSTASHLPNARPANPAIGDRGTKPLVSGRGGKRASLLILPVAITDPTLGRRR
ncbi:hypothetical protein B0T16DRAFT_418732 [Cercophora newfieldiana]|uniref:Uncharacterized protein n=1 Tax=Cercophora newfieldiana TaxID=92897 RepID=A0AA39XVC4_9PEZI|nr:hypothetical protein B0T16DRAFT_418732 [Cercophora newfieldiana]